MGLTRILTIIPTLFIVSLGVYAQTGSIHGTVSDSLSHEPLIGARVQLVELDSMAIVDANGEYAFAALPPGTYKLRFTFIGYQTITVKDVHIAVSTKMKLDAVMQESSPKGLQIQIHRKWNDDKD